MWYATVVQKMCVGNMPNGEGINQLLGTLVQRKQQVSGPPGII